MDNKTFEVLNTVFPKTVDTMKDVEAQKLLVNYIHENLKDDKNFENLNFSVFVEDIKKKRWKSKEHFVKIFYDEIKYAQKKYDISDKAIVFLFKLGEFLLWEINLLVDEKNNPLNQKQLANKLQMNDRTVRRTMSELVLKNIIYKEKIHSEVFYFVNPYVMFCGKNINILIPKLFCNYECYRNNRDKRHKKVTKRNSIRKK